jgi:hypothetical protein
MRKERLPCIFEAQWIGTNCMLCFPGIELAGTQDFYALGYVLVMLQKWHTSSNILSMFLAAKCDWPTPTFLGLKAFVVVNVDVSMRRK